MISIPAVSPPRRCRFVSPDKCPEPAVYTVELAECALCQRLGFLFCAGHSACLEHGAKLRADGYVWRFGDDGPDDGQDVTVARISATYREAS